MSNNMTKAEYRTFLAERGVKTTTRTPLTELRKLYADAVTAQPAEEAASTADEAAVADFTAEPAEAAQIAPDATFAARGNYNTVWVPLAEVLAADERAEVKVWLERESVMLVNVHIAGPKASPSCGCWRRSPLAPSPR